MGRALCIFDLFWQVHSVEDRNTIQQSQGFILPISGVIPSKGGRIGMHLQRKHWLSNIIQFVVKLLTTKITAGSQKNSDQCSWIFTSLACNYNWSVSALLKTILQIHPNPNLTKLRGTKTGFWHLPHHKFEWHDILVCMSNCSCSTNLSLQQWLRATLDCQQFQFSYRGLFLFIDVAKMHSC